jgi:hypothetical protein
MTPYKEQVRELAVVITDAKRQAAQFGHTRTIYAAMGWEHCQGGAPVGRVAEISVHANGSCYDLRSLQMNRDAIRMAEPNGGAVRT